MNNFFSYFLLCFLCVLFQIIFLFVEKKGKMKLSLLFKGLASLMFIILGFLCMQKGQNKKFAAFIVTGLIFDGIGDVVINLRFAFEKIKHLSFLGGAAFFFVGHVLYLVSLISISDLSIILWSCVITAILITVVMKLIHLKRRPPLYRVAGVIYFSTICLMVCIAAGNLILNFSSIYAQYARVFFVGAVLFIASDIILVKNTFAKKKNYVMRVTNLVLYYIGQLLIGLSLLFI